MEKIQTLSNPNQKKEAAFIALVAEKNVWENYEGLTKEDRETPIALTLMINRWDGALGFPGGKVEAGETPTLAAVREAKEEIGLTISEKDLIPLCSHEFSIVTHLFVVKISFEEMVEIYNGISKAQHFASEICGGYIAHLHEYDKGKGFSSLLESQLAKSVKEELLELYDFTRIVRY